MSKKTNHTHKLKKISFKTTGGSIYICVLNCSYKISPQLALGKISVCWRCGKDFYLTEYSLRLVKPHCDGCHVSKDKKNTEPIEDIPLMPAIPDDSENMTLMERLKKESGSIEEDL